MEQSPTSLQHPNLSTGQFRTKDIFVCHECITSVSFCLFLFCNAQWITAATPPLPPTPWPSPVETPGKVNRLHKTQNSKQQMRYIRSYQLWDVEAIISSIMIHCYIDGRDPAHTTLNTYSVERDLGRNSWETARVRLCLEHSHTFTRRTKIYQAPTSHWLQVSLVPVLSSVPHDPSLSVVIS